MATGRCIGAIAGHGSVLFSSNSQSIRPLKGLRSFHHLLQRLAVDPESGPSSSLLSSRGFSSQTRDPRKSPKRAEMPAAASSFSGNLKKAVAGIRRIDLDGLRWRVFDAKGQVLGRLASQLSVVLQGKDKPTYAPNRDDGDICIVLNAKDICVTGRKLTDKVYYWHTGYVGNLKERTLKDQMAKDPTQVIRKAVLRMLPRNNLRDDRDRKLRIFTDGEHPFGDRPLEPYVMPPRNVREMRPRARRAMVRAQKRAEHIEQKQKKGKGEQENAGVSA